ncbi:MAG: peptide chain release factor N(5)-glutamine methyltransferase [Lachnospiraceae bacterium]
MRISWNELLEQGEAVLRQAGVSESKLDAWYLLSYVFQINRMNFLMTRNIREEKEESLLHIYEELIEKRAQRIPLQYLTHEQEFMGMKFYVDESVLIPRQDTECLVEEILNDFSGRQQISIMDMCTGSGCIGISLKKLGQFEEVFAADISVEALKVAQKNAQNLSAELKFYESDLFAAIPTTKTYDVIVSNPPYISESERSNLMPEVVVYEPSMALFAEEEGTVFYRRLAQAGRNYLKEDGWIYFEIGCEQADAVSQILKECGYHQISVRRDLAGLDRVVKARK